MAYSFLKIMEDMKIGGSIYDKSAPEVVPRILEKAKANNVEIILPVDFICGNKFSEESEVKGPVMDRLQRSTFLEQLTGRVFLSQFEAFNLR